MDPLTKLLAEVRSLLALVAAALGAAGPRVCMGGPSGGASAGRGAGAAGGVAGVGVVRFCVF